MMRTVGLFLLALVLLAPAGCARWNAERFDLSHLRDPRAADLDERLSSRPEAIANPFGSAGSELR